MHASVCHSWLGWLGMVDRIKCFTVFRNILDEIINYLLGCRGMLKYFFRAQISKQHVWCMWNIYCGDCFIYQVHFLVDVCMPVAFSDQPSCVLVFGCDPLRLLSWGDIFHSTPASVEVSLQAYSESRSFWNMHFSGIWILKNFGMKHLISGVYSEGASLIFRISFERKVQPHLGLLLWHCSSAV